jgi:hypothetical protein
MAVFAILPNDPNSAALAARVNATVPKGDFVRLPGGQWLIAHTGTTREVGDLLGLSEGETTDGVVCSISSYWGRATKDVWEWLNSKTS